MYFVLTCARDKGSIPAPNSERIWIVKKIIVAPAEVAHETEVYS